MGVVSFSKRPKDTWQVAGWAFRQVLDDTLQLLLDDVELQQVFENAKLYDGLSVEELRPEMADRVTSAMRQIADGVLAGTLTSGIESKPYGNAATRDQYKAGLRELLLVLPNRE